VYYRCNTRDCPTLTIREDVVQATIQRQLTPLGLTTDEAAELKERAASMRAITKASRRSFASG